jgi:hypothetical protein
MERDFEKRGGRRNLSGLILTANFFHGYLELL